MPTTASLTDNFDDGVLAAAWASYGSNLSETGGRLVIDTLTSGYAGIYSVASDYDFTNSSLTIELPVVPSAQEGTSVYIEVTVGGGNYYRWEYVGGSNSISARRKVAGVYSELGSVPYVAANHRWLRMREVQGSVYWDVSGNGTDWRTLFSGANGQVVTAAGLGVGAGIYAAVTSPGGTSFDNINLVPADTVAPIITNGRARYVTRTAARLAWTTNEGGDSQIEWGATTALGTVSGVDPYYRVSHEIATPNLAQNAPVYYRVRSRDAAGNLTIWPPLADAPATFSTTNPVTTGVVTLAGSPVRLRVDGNTFIVKGINYHPQDLPVTAPPADVPHMKALGANVIGTYHCARVDYGPSYEDITDGEQFYDSLEPKAAERSLKLLVAFVSAEVNDWTDPYRVIRLEDQWQAFVRRVMRKDTTLMYMIGNETIEKLSTDAQRTAYAKWIGRMVDWTHDADPSHPVCYAHNASYQHLEYLKTHAPNLDMHAFNNYNFTDQASLTSILDGYATEWPGKPLFLHEWGCDSWNQTSAVEDQPAQATRIASLARTINSVVSATAHPFIGALHFSYTDQWSFVSPSTTQDADLGWDAPSCFDGKANEDYWGLADRRPLGDYENRVRKSAYTALRDVWVTLKGRRSLSQYATGAGSRRLHG